LNFNIDLIVVDMMCRLLGVMKHLSTYDDSEINNFSLGLYGTS